MRHFSVISWPIAVSVLLVLESIGACNCANAQSQLDSSGIPQATSTFPVEHGIVNLNNGVLHLEIPIVNYAQRGNVQLPATLNYDSNIWKVSTDALSGFSDWLPDATAPSGQNTSGGWYVSYHPTNQSITPVQYGFNRCSGSSEFSTEIESGISWMDQSGSTHIFPATLILSGTGCTGVDGNSYVTNTAAAAYATDGSGYYAVVTDCDTAASPAVNIYDRSGSLVGSNNLNLPIIPGCPAGQPDGSSASFGGIGLSSGPVLPVDRNGNSPVYNGSTILDTMGRNLINDTGIEDVTGVGTVEYISVPVAGGNTATYTINYKTITVATSFGYSSVRDVSGISMVVVSSVALPDGSSYQFDYNENSFGEVKSMTLPHGGQVSFTYATSAGISGGIPTRWVQSHTGSDGATTFSWSQTATSSYSQAGTACGLITNQVTTLSAKNTYKFSNCNSNILLQEVDHGSATSSAIDAIDLYSYDTTHPCPTIGTATVYHIGCNGLQWMNITGKTTVLPANGGSGTSMVTDTQYSYANPGSGIPTTVKQWDYYPGAPTSLPDSPPGLPTKEVDTTLGYSVNGALFPTVVNQKDPTGSIVSSTTYTYDEPAYLSSTPSTAPNHSDALVTGNRGNLTTVQQCCGWNGSSDVTLQSHVWYDDAGTVQKIQNADTYLTTFSAYDPTDTFPTTVTLPNTTSPTGAVVSHIIQKTYDPNSGQLASVTDENGQTTTYTFDQYGRPYQVKFSNAGSPVTLQTTTYPSANETDVSVLQSTGVLLSATTIVDSYGRPYKSTQSGITTETHYDAQGRLYTVTNPYGSTPSSTDGVTSYSHDELGRLSSVTLPNGYSTTYMYAQNTVTVTDPLRHSRQIWSDAFGNTSYVFEPNKTGTSNYITHYLYNWNNELVKVLQQGETSDTSKWRIRTFSYDGVGRLVSQTTPEAGTMWLGYDNNGNLTSTKNQNPTNNTTTYTYDALNRAITTTVGGGPTYTYTYDEQEDPFGKGLLTSASNGTNVQTQWQHDALGRTISSAYCLPSDCSFGYKVQSSFDFQGNPTSLTYPDTRQVSWTYDQLNRPVSETYAQFGSNVVNTPYVSNISYTPGGQLQQATIGNSALQFGATYDSDANLSSLVYVANGSPIVEKTYTWDKNASNLTNITDLAAGRTQAYQYDQLDRLFSLADSGTTANSCNANLPSISPASQTYTIDAWGNMEQDGVWSFTGFEFPNNQIQGYDYDAAGNQQRDARGNSFLYRSDGLMTSSNSNTYTYDALGQRVRKDGASSNEYIYFGGQLLAMRNPSTNTWTDRIYGPMGALATVPGTQSGLPVYRAADHLGSLSFTLDSSGNITGSSNVLPYGQLTSNTTNDAFPFTDHERDSDGTDATQYRHYASSQGRWLSPDPSNASYDLLDPQSLNRYAYLANRPMAKVDRLGLDGDDDGDDDYDDGDDDGDDGGWWSDIEDFFDFGGSDEGPQGPALMYMPSVPSIGSPGTTQVGGGAAYLVDISYNSGSTGVSTGAWTIVDTSSGLDLDGISSIPMALLAQQPSPQLSFATVSGGPHASPWRIQWKLSKPSETGGYIIQHIQASDKNGPVDYYEAWEVRKGAQVTTLSPAPWDDQFIADQGATVRATATAKFYDGMQLLPREFRPFSVYPAGILPATYHLEDPLPTSNVSKPVIRTWSVP